MRLVNVETFRLEEFIGDAIPSYAILSHTWGADADEVSFRDIEHANSEGLANRHIKLAGCCRQARLDRLQYVWIDTCCIDKANSVELGEAINSMFRWYQNAAVCYAYLSDVPRGGVGPQFPASRWFMRGWTLQELLAPKTLVFYNVDWEPLGSKIELSSLIQEITGIPRPFLSGWAALHEASVAQRMSWASRRITKRKEDEAYSLLGIFGISMAMIYGEGESAFKRLQEEIIKVSSDHSIFAWGLDGSAFDAATSTGVQLGGLLAKSPAEFANCGNIACRKQHTGTRSLFDLSNGYLRIKLPVYALHNGLTYGLLMCGPELEDEKVVGIPLEVENAQSDKSNEEYLRPKGRLCVLLDETIPGAEAKQISISTETQSRSSLESSRHHWFYVGQPIGSDLELVDVYPWESWHQDDSMISTASFEDSPDQSTVDSTRQYLVNFRVRDGTFRDFLVVLDFIAESNPRVRFHVRTIPRFSSLGQLRHDLTSLEHTVTRNHTASDGPLKAYFTVKRGFVAGQPVFVVRGSLEQSGAILPTLAPRTIAGESQETPQVNDELPIDSEDETLGLLSNRRTSTLRNCWTGGYADEGLTRSNGFSAACQLTLWTACIVSALFASFYLILSAPSPLPSIDSNLAAISFNDSQEVTHRTVFFQSPDRSLVARRWNSRNRTWETHDLSSVLQGDPGGTVRLLRHTPLAAVSADRPSLRTYLFFVDDNYSIRSIWLDESAGSHTDEEWVLDSPLIPGTISRTSSLGAAWLPCADAGCDRGIINVVADFDRTPTLHNSSDWKTPTFIRDVKTMGPGLALAPAPKSPCATANNMTLVVMQDPEELPSGGSGFWLYSYDGSQWRYSGDALPGSRYIDANMVRLQSTVASFNFFGWTLSLILILLRDGTIIGGDLRNTELMCAGREPFPTKNLQLGKPPRHAMRGTISAISATLDGMLYGISNGRVLEYSVSRSHPYHWDYMGVAWP